MSTESPSPRPDTELGAGEPDKLGADLSALRSEEIEKSPNRVQDEELAQAMALAADKQATRAAKARKMIAGVDAAHDRHLDRRAQAYGGLTGTDPGAIVDLGMQGLAGGFAVAEAGVPKLADTVDKLHQKARTKLAEKANRHDSLASEAMDEAERNYHPDSEESPR